VVAYDQREHAQIFPQSGWVEHDPQEIWTRAREVIGATLANAGVRARDISAVGVTNQRETAIVWNRHTGQPVYNAIVWQDTRTDRFCRQLQDDGHAPLIYRKTGLPIATYFSGPKIRWLLDNVPGVRTQAEAGDLLFGNVDTWIIWNLTGRHVTDPSNASRTMLMNLATLDWDEELLQIIGVPRSLLPEIRPSSDPRFLWANNQAWSLPGGRYRFAAIWVINRQPLLGRHVLRQVRPKTPMAPAASCC
jgi:glycerol kinase